MTARDRPLAYLRGRGAQVQASALPRRPAHQPGSPPLNDLRPLEVVLRDHRAGIAFRGGGVGVAHQCAELAHWDMGCQLSGKGHPCAIEVVVGEVLPGDPA